MGGLWAHWAGVGREQVLACEASKEQRTSGCTALAAPLTTRPLFPRPAAAGVSRSCSSPCTHQGTTGVLFLRWLVRCGCGRAAGVRRQDQLPHRQVREGELWNQLEIRVVVVNELPVGHATSSCRQESIRPGWTSANSQTRGFELHGQDVHATRQIDVRQDSRSAPGLSDVDGHGAGPVDLGETRVARRLLARCMILICAGARWLRGEGQQRAWAQSWKQYAAWREEYPTGSATSTGKHGKPPHRRAPTAKRTSLKGRDAARR